jgi:hypothetical protein
MQGSIVMKVFVKLSYTNKMFFLRNKEQEVKTGPVCGQWEDTDTGKSCRMVI